MLYAEIVDTPDRTPLDNPDTARYWNQWARVWNPFLRSIRLDRRYREEGISVLRLGRGMVVLDVACGTGFNFPFLVDAVGPEGRVIAVDLSPGMLRRAADYALRNGWGNIEFILGDVSRMRLPAVDAACAFWCMISIPDYHRALGNIVSSLGTGGRIALIDFKLIEGTVGRFLNPLSRLLFRVTRQDLNRRPWCVLRESLGNACVREWKHRGLLISNVYLAWGQKVKTTD